MTLQNLLQNVASGLRGEAPEPGYEFCYQGDMGMCARCPVEKNRKRCPLTDDEYLERWVAWHVRRIVADPTHWADEAYEQVREWSNPGMMIFLELAYDLPLESDAMGYWREKTQAVLKYWDGWLARFAVEARERAQRNPGNLDFIDVADAVESVLALTDSITHKERQHDD